MKCVQCERRIDNMNPNGKSRDCWVWFNDNNIICKKHIMYAQRHGLDDPRLSQIESIDNEQPVNEHIENQIALIESSDEQPPIDYNNN